VNADGDAYEKPVDVPAVGPDDAGAKATVAAAGAENDDTLVPVLAGVDVVFGLDVFGARGFTYPGSALGLMTPGTPTAAGFPVTADVEFGATDIPPPFVPDGTNGIPERSAIASAGFTHD